MDSFIVKVQLPLEGTAEPQILVYDQDRSFEQMFPVTPKIVAAMNGSYKEFWYAHLEGTNLQLDGIAPWQDW